MNPQDLLRQALSGGANAIGNAGGAINQSVGQMAVGGMGALRDALARRGFGGPQGQLNQVTPAAPSAGNAALPPQPGQGSGVPQQVQQAADNLEGSEMQRRQMQAANLQNMGNQQVPPFGDGGSAIQGQAVHPDHAEAKIILNALTSRLKSLGTGLGTAGVAPGDPYPRM